MRERSDCAKIPPLRNIDFSNIEICSQAKKKEIDQKKEALSEGRSFYLKVRQKFSQEDCTKETVETTEEERKDKEIHLSNCAIA